MDCTGWLSDSRTRSNHDQPKPNENNQLAGLLGSPRSRWAWGTTGWGSPRTRGRLGAADLSAAMDTLWPWPADHELLPGDVVCSPLAALYDLPQVGWAHPDLG